MRRIPLSHGSHVIGFRPLGGTSIDHESTLERDFVTVTAFIDPLASIRSQPITIEYEDGVRCRRYTPDFEIFWGDGRHELVEIKYRADLKSKWRELRPGFAAARAWAVSRGGRFRIATARGIRGPLLANAKRLLPLREAVLDESCAAVIMVAARSESTFAQLVERTAGDRGLVLATVWRLIARGKLRVDINEPIGGRSRISLA